MFATEESLQRCLAARSMTKKCLSTYDSAAKSHQASFSPEYMGVGAEHPPPYIPAKALSGGFFSGVPYIKANRRERHPGRGYRSGLCGYGEDLASIHRLDGYTTQPK